MNHTVHLTSRAQFDLAAMPPKHSDAVLAYIFERLVENPGRMSKPLHGPLEGLRVARVGKIVRVVFRLADDADVIEVTAVDYRARIYGRG